MQVIPSIDVLGGKVVRLRQGDFGRVTEFGNDPALCAAAYKNGGAKRLHLVNLSGAKEGGMNENFLAVIRRIADATKLELQVGGGIRTLADIEASLDAGASKVVVGTMLVRRPTVVKAALNLFGVDRLIGALDVRGQEVQIQGWQEGSGFDLEAACRLTEETGIREILVTDIARDGMEQGPNAALYERLNTSFPSLRLIGSGGVRNAEDVRQLQSAGCSAVVIGRALLNQSVSIGTVLAACSAHDSPKKNTAGSTLAVRVIPCLDVTGGRVVKGTSFQNLRDAGDPVELAKRYCEEGADELVFLDISATKEERATVFELASKVADAINIPFTIGGGVRSVADAKRLLDAGADKVSINTAASENPSLLSEIAEELGVSNTVCTIDAKRTANGWTVLTHGGRNNTEKNALDWAVEAVKRGAGELLVTSYDRDGTGEGFDTALLARIKERVKVPVIASGGAGSLQSFVDAVEKGRADAVLAASVFHFRTFSVRDVKMALQNASFPVRI